MRDWKAGLAVSVYVLGLGGLAFAEEPSVTQAPEADRAAIQQVIGAQIDAFLHDDADSAFRLAAPKIQAVFGDPTRFLHMVQQAYQPVYRPRSVSFGALVNEQGVWIQHVELMGRDGDAQTALYQMEHEADGTWRIDGCALVQSDAVGA